MEYTIAMFMQLPVLLKIAVVFFVIVFASSRKLHLGLAAALGGIAFALWSGLPFLGTLDAALAELTSGDTLLMLALMTGIMAFSAGMKKAGAMDAFARSLCELVPSRRVAMAAAPLFIGTLPMPGGAILSAPLVDAMDPRRIRGSDTLTAANYWFRHCLELAWPLYPAFILTSSLSGLGVGRLMALNAYAIPLLFMLGLLFILPAGKDPGRAGASKGGPVRKVQDTGGMSLRKRWRAFAAGAAPLAMVLGVYVALDIVWKLVSPSLEIGRAPV